MRTRTSKRSSRGTTGEPTAGMWRRVSPVALVAAVLVMGGLAESTPAQNICTDQVSKLIAADAATEDQFGIAVAVHGDTAVIGAHQDNPNGFDSGSAYIFVEVDDGQGGTQWQQQQKLVPADGSSLAHFGFSVDIHGDWVIIGAYGDDEAGDNAGAAYIYQRAGTSWPLREKVTASDAAPSDFFGYSVAIDGDLAIIGAYWDDDNGLSSGSAYIFQRDNIDWLEQQKLTADDGELFDQFGVSVDIAGSAAIVGAYWDDDVADNAGAAYIFTSSKGQWSLQQKLTPSDGQSSDFFGQRVALNVVDSDAAALIGARSHDAAGDNAGAAYVYQHDGDRWTEQTKLLAPDATGGELFGASVSLDLAADPPSAVIGAVAGEIDGVSSGAAHLFVRDNATWVHEQKMTPDDPQAGQQFGSASGVSGDRIVVGAHLDDQAANEAGAAYTFTRLSGADCSCELDIANNDGQVGVAELLQVLKSWGQCPGCPADFNNDDMVGTADLLMLLDAWGECP